MRIFRFLAEVSDPGRLVEEDLEDIGIAVACFDGEESAVRGHTAPRTLRRASSPLCTTRGFNPLMASSCGFRLSVYPCFVAFRSLFLFVFRTGA